jgi:hypothetical protein
LVSIFRETVRDGFTDLPALQPQPLEHRWADRSFGACRLRSLISMPLRVP